MYSQIQSIPTQSEYDAIFDEIFADFLQDYLDYYGITETSPNYESELANAIKVVKETYPEQYWYEFVMYQYVMDIIISSAIRA